MNFKAGQKVVCVKPDQNWFAIPMGISGFFRRLFNKWKYVPGLENGKTYTVVRVKHNGYLFIEGFESIGAYHPSYFRPIEDMWSEEMLEGILEKAKQEELVEV